MRITITLEKINEKPVLVGGVIIKKNMTVQQIKDAMTEASKLVEQRLVDMNLLGYIADD